MTIAGSKRALQQTSNGDDCSESKRLAQTGPDGKPVLKQLGRLENLPPDLLSTVLRFLDLQTYLALFRVSSQIKARVAEIKPIRHDEFRFRMGLLDFIGRVRWTKENAPMLLQRFGCAFFSMDDEDLDDLLALARRNDVEYLMLEDVRSDLDSLLRDLDGVVGSRQNGSRAPLPCQLLLGGISLDVASDIGADIEPVLKALKHLKIVSLSVDDRNLLELTRHMPALEELCVHLGVRLSQVDVREVLESRREPIPRVRISAGESEELSSEFIQMLARLEVRHVCYKKCGLFEPEWKQCKLESLELCANLDREDMAGIADMLDGFVVKALVLREVDDDPSEAVNLGVIAQAVQSNTSLQRLEVKLCTDTPTAHDADLLMAVLENPKIVYASLPYPLELQKYVDQAMAADTDLKIRRTNDYTGAADKLGKIVAKRIAASQAD